MPRPKKPMTIRIPGFTRSALPRVNRPVTPHPGIALRPSPTRDGKGPRGTK